MFINLFCFTSCSCSLWLLEVQQKLQALLLTLKVNMVGLLLLYIRESTGGSRYRTTNNTSCSHGEVVRMDYETVQKPKSDNKLHFLN